MQDEAHIMSTIANDVVLGKNVLISNFINLYGCTIGDATKVGPFVEIQKNAVVGSNCKISSHTFICEGVTIEDNVFVGHGVTFINDLYPRATSNGRLQTEADWDCLSTRVKHGASIGSGATILCGITIGENAIVGAGSVVTHDIPPDSIVAGNPAEVLRTINSDADIFLQEPGEITEICDSELLSDAYGSEGNASSSQDLFYCRGNRGKPHQLVTNKEAKDEKLL